MPNASDAADRGRIAHFLDFAREKQSIAEFLSAFDSLFPYIHERKLTASYRLAEKSLKKVRDESAVLVHFLQKQNHYRFIRQNLGNDIPDAWLWTDSACIDVEITVALATMRRAIVERLNTFGASPGFLPLADGHDVTAYRAAAGADSGGYSPEQYLEVLYSGVMDRARKKTMSDRRGILLIDCPIGEEYASTNMIDQLVDKIVPDLPESGFERIYLVDKGRVAKVK